LWFGEEVGLWFEGWRSGGVGWFYILVNCRSDGLVECWFGGVLAWWNAGLVECWFGEVCCLVAEVMVWLIGGLLVLWSDSVVERRSVVVFFSQTFAVVVVW
jgi:hypothetical protein